MNKYLTVLDFNTGTTHIYKLTSVQLPNDETVEKFMEEQGHRVSDCEWMLADNIKMEI